MASDIPNPPLQSSTSAKAPSFANFSFKHIGPPSLLKRLSTATHNDAPIEGDDAGYKSSTPADDLDMDDDGDTPVNNKIFDAVNDQLRSRHSRLDNLISSFVSHENALKELTQLTTSAIVLSKEARETSARGLGFLEQSQVAFQSATETAARALELSHILDTRVKSVLAQQAKQESQIAEVRKELHLLAELINAHGIHEERHIRERQQRECRREMERERKRAEEERQLREKMVEYEAALAQIREQLASKSRERDSSGCFSSVQINPNISTSAQLNVPAAIPTTQSVLPESQKAAVPPSSNEQSRREAEEQRAREAQRLKELEELAKKHQQEAEAAELKKRELQLRLDQERRQAERMLIDQEPPLQTAPSVPSSAPSPSTASLPLSSTSHTVVPQPPATCPSAKKKKNKRKPEPIVVKKESSSASQSPLIPNSSLNLQIYPRDGTAASGSATGGSTSPVVDRFNEHIAKSGGYPLPLKPEVKEVDAKPVSNAPIPTTQESRSVIPPSQPQNQQPFISSTTVPSPVEQSRANFVRPAGPAIVETRRDPVPAERPPVPPIVEKEHNPRPPSTIETRPPGPSSPEPRTLPPQPVSRRRYTGDNSHVPPSHPPPSARPVQYESLSPQDSSQARRPPPVNDARQSWRDASPMGPEDSARTGNNRYLPPPQPSRYDHWSPPPDTRRAPTRTPTPPPPRHSLKRTRMDVEPPSEYPPRRQPYPNRSILDRLDRVDTFPGYHELQYPGSRSSLTPPRRSVSPSRDERPSFLERLEVPQMAKERERDCYRPNPPLRGPVSPPRGRRSSRARGGRAPLASRITSSSLQDRLGI